MATRELEETIAMYREGLLNQWELHAGVAAHLDEDNIDEVMALFRTESLPLEVESLTGPHLGVTNPDPTREQVARAHAAVERWLDRNPEYRRYAKPPFWEPR